MKYLIYSFLGCALAALTMRQASTSLAQEEQAERIKAAYVFNFLKFVEWPCTNAAETRAPLRFVTIGNDSITTAIKNAINGKSAQGRLVNVISFPDVSEWKMSAIRCEAIFITAAMRASWREISTALLNQPVLTISDSQGFCAANGMLNLLEENNRIRFEANPSVANLAGLKMRAEFLKLATIIKREEPP